MAPSLPINKIYLPIPLWICLGDSVVPHSVYFMVLLGLGCHLVSMGLGCQYYMLFFLKGAAVG